ncbi:MAG TPA: DUF4105 domain-containing protein, partial [Polyangiaceae bacterium]|nr:DUF4105 domain-containing protein [Polyangiaceae bacterium]
MKFIYALAAGFALLVAEKPAAAFTGPPARVSVLTMGPGDHPFARFGHNAIVLEWPRQAAVVYNFGTFAFDGLQGVEDFMAGRFRYWLSVSSLARTLGFYERQERSLVAQELELTAEERGRLAEALLQNSLPENKFYNYDYYLDNCSTRVRDAVDKLLDGELARQFQGAPGRLTFREHTERLTAGAGWLYFGLDLALGPLTDRPTTRWNDLFVPGELHDALAHAKRKLNGAEVPLVRAEHVLLRDARPEMLRDPPARVPLFAGLGLVLGGGFAGLGHLAARKRLARVAFGVLSSLFGFVLGLLGTIFVVFWAFTKHWSAYRNENILVCPPWALPLLVLGVGVALGRTKARALSHRVLTLAALGAALALLLAIVPGFGQDNTRVAALLAPLWLGLYAGSAFLEGRPLWPPFK